MMLHSPDGTAASNATGRRMLSSPRPELTSSSASNITAAAATAVGVEGVLLASESRKNRIQRIAEEEASVLHSFHRFSQPGASASRERFGGSHNNHAEAATSSDSLFFAPDASNPTSRGIQSPKPTTPTPTNHYSFNAVGAATAATTYSTSSSFAADNMALRIQLEARKAELDTKQRHIGALESQNYTLQKEVDAVNARLCEAKERVSAQCTKELEAEQQSARTSSEELRKEKILRKELESVNRALQHQLSEMPMLTHRLAETKILLSQRNELIERLQTERWEARDELQAAMANDRSRVLQGRIEALTALIEEREESIEAKDDKFTALFSRLETAEADVTSLQQERQAKKRELQELTSALITEKQSQEKLVEYKEMSEARSDQQQLHVRQLEDALHAQGIAKDTMENEHAMQLREQDIKVQDLETRLSEVTSELSCCASERAKADSVTATLRTELKEKDKEVFNLRSVLDKLEAQAAKDQVLALNHQNDVRDLSAQVAALLSELNDARQRTAQTHAQERDERRKRATGGQLSPPGYSSSSPMKREQQQQEQVEERVAQHLLMEEGRFEEEEADDLTHFADDHLF